MADLYVDGDLAPITIGGSLTTGGTGTSGDPYYTIAQALSACANGDTIHVQGRCRQATSVASKTGLTIKQWAGETQAEIRGDVVVGFGSWSLGAGNRYVATIGAGLSIKSVVLNWDDSTYFGNANIHGNHMAAAASAAACEATANSWFYDGAGGILHVNLNGTDPTVAGITVAWCRAGNGLTWTSMTSGLVSGLHFKLWPDAAANNGYGFYGDSCASCEVYGCSTWDTGYHAIGWIGSTCVNNRINTCTCWGQRAGGSQTVLYGSSGSVSGRVRSCTFHLYTLLTRAGTALDAAAAADAFYSHTDGTNGTLTDIEVRDCTATVYTGHTSTSPYACGSLTSVVADGDEQNWRAYPVRFVSCNVIDGGRLVYSDTSGSNEKHVAYVRCNLDLATNSDANTILAQAAAGGTIKCKLLFESCVVYRGTADGRLFWLQAGVRVIARCSTFRNNTTTNPGLSDNIIFKISDGADVKQLVCKQCVFSAGVAYPFIHEDGLATRSAANYDLDQCWYDGFGATWFLRGHSTNESKANYKANIDTEAAGAVYDVTPGFTNTATGEFEGTPGSRLRSVTLHQAAQAGLVGINGRLYDGHWGPYQYAVLRRRDRTNPASLRSRQ